MIILIPLFCIIGLCNIHFARMYRQLDAHIEDHIHTCAKDVKYHFETALSHIRALSIIIAEDIDFLTNLDNDNMNLLCRKGKNFKQLNVSLILFVDKSFHILCQIGKLPVFSDLKELHPFFQNIKLSPKTSIVGIDNQLYAISVCPRSNHQGFVVVGRLVYPDIYKKISDHLNVKLTIRYNNITIGIDPNNRSFDNWKQKTIPIFLNGIILQVTIYQQAELFDSIIESRKDLLFYSFIIFVILCLIIAVLVHRLIFPINDLIDAMYKYSKGELRLSSLPEVKNEIGKLYQAFHRMIIDLEHAEQRFQRIFKYAIEGLFQTHPDGYFIRTNPALAKIFGYATPEELVSNISDLANQLYVHSEDRDRFKNLITKNNQVMNFETQMYKQNGEIIWVQINGRAVRDKNGQIIYYEGFLVDIDARKRGENKEKERKALEMANQTKSEFLANISHEIRTPLNAVIGLGKLLKKTSLTDLQNEYLTDILNASQTLLDLINDILDYSRVELDKIKLMPTQFFLVDIYQSIISIFKYQVQSKKMAMVCHIAPECGIELTGDPIRIKQVLVNLVGNAVKFTHNGQIWIQTESLHQTSDKLFISISVTDTGVGIQENDQKHIFQAFTQAESNINRKYCGAGLGLAISEKLVQLMQGKFFVSSVPSKGSTFTITLPFAYKDSNARQKLPEHNSRVLLIEDDPIHARFAQSILNDENLDVDIIEDSHHVLSQIQKNSYDMVFMDIQLPQIDGYELTQMIRDAGYVTLPVIALTACSMKGDREKCLAAGINDYLPKPYAPEDIIGMYHKWKASVCPME
jgi:PAS domain S-box-containing protein